MERIGTCESCKNTTRVQYYEGVVNGKQLLCVGCSENVNTTQKLTKAEKELLAWIDKIEEEEKITSASVLRILDKILHKIEEEVACPCWTTNEPVPHSPTCSERSPHAGL